MPNLLSQFQLFLDQTLHEERQTRVQQGGSDLSAKMNFFKAASGTGIFNKTDVSLRFGNFW
jgi:hypothetical protein